MSDATKGKSLESLAELLAVARELELKAPSKREVEARDEDTLKLQRQQYLSESNIGGAITAEDREWLTHDTLPRSTPALESVQRWYVARATNRRARTMKVLLGETGRGKTVAAAWLLARVGGSYVTSERMRYLMASHYPKQRNEFERLAETRVLVVDDVGFETDPATASATLFEIVNWRQGLANGWTILTGNLSVADFALRFGERTVRRIEHQGEIDQCGGPDLRRKCEGEE